VTERLTIIVPLSPRQWTANLDHLVEAVAAAVARADGVSEDVAPSDARPSLRSFSGSLVAEPASVSGRP